MAKEKTYLTRHDLGSLFDGSFRLIKPTWKNSLAINAIIWVPCAVISMMQIKSMFGGIAAILEAGGAFTWSNMAPFWSAYGVSMLASLIQGIIALFGSAALARNAWGTISREAKDWKALLSETFRLKLGRLVGLVFLQILIYLGIFLAFGILVAAACFLMAAVPAMVAPAVFILILAYAALIAAIFALNTYLEFCLTALALEDIGPGKAIKTSFRIVKGNFWRVFGITFLFSMAVSMIVSMITTPLAFAGMAPFYQGLLSSMSAFDSSSMDSFMRSYLFLMLESFNNNTYLVCMGFSTLIQGILVGLVTPLFTTLFYIDLKVRKGELADTANYQSLDSGSGPGADFRA